MSGRVYRSLHCASLPKWELTHTFRPLAHDPEKWIPVFGKDHAQSKSRDTCSCSSVGSERLTVDQEVGGSNPPSCTSYHTEKLWNFLAAVLVAIGAVTLRNHRGTTSTPLVIAVLFEA
jgi:hypothetical protein